MKHIAIALVILMSFYGQAIVADQNERLKNIEISFANWMKENDVSNGTLSVFQKDTVLKTTMIGDAAQERFALASLSKSITGSCILDLIDKGLIKSETKLSEVFGDHLQELDLKNATNADITIAQLLAQSSGLFPDSTQPRMLKWLNSKRDRHERVAGHALRREVQQGTRGTFAYNNENYAILGAIIEQVTGQGYVQYCRDAVLSEHGITTATLSGEYGAYAAWGGWEMSVSDFAKFLWAHYSPNSKYGGAPLAAPNTPVDGGVFYGAGTFVRQGRVGHNFWHHGAICMGKVSQTGSFFAFWQGEIGVVVAYDKCPDWDMMLSLDVALAQAAFGGR